MKVKKLVKNIAPFPMVKQIVKFNDVKVCMDRKMFFPKTGYRHKEGGVVYAHKKFTEKGDNVVIIGGGHGITAVNASWIVGEKGTVTVFEAGFESFEHVKETIRLNNVNNVAVIHGVVGYGSEVRGSTINAELVKPDSFSNCDVLEIDVDGAEIPILKKLDIKPRLIIVEVHPYRFDEEPLAVNKILEEKGYDIVYYSDHDGVKLTAKQAKELLIFSKDYNGTYYYKQGIRFPVVLGAVKRKGGS